MNPPEVTVSAIMVAEEEYEQERGRERSLPLVVSKSSRQASGCGSTDPGQEWLNVSGGGTRGRVSLRLARVASVCSVVEECWDIPTSGIVSGFLNLDTTSGLKIVLILKVEKWADLKYCKHWILQLSGSKISNLKLAT